MMDRFVLHRSGAMCTPAVPKLALTSVVILLLCFFEVERDSLYVSVAASTTGSEVGKLSCSRETRVGLDASARQERVIPYHSD